MAAIAHASPAGMPAQIRSRLAVVGTRPVLPSGPVGAATTVYRRRQAVAAAAVVTVVAVLGSLVLAVAGALGSSGRGSVAVTGRPGGAAVYVVQPGDTFWGIARRLHPGEDPRPLVARLVAAHGSPMLTAGERLSLPSAA